MKKRLLMVLMTAVMATSGVVSYAAETSNAATTTSTATTVTEKAKSGDAGATTGQKSEQDNNSGSLYDSVRSGWNKFIDLLAGPKQ